MKGKEKSKSKRRKRTRNKGREEGKRKEGRKKGRNLLGRREQVLAREIKKMNKNPGKEAKQEVDSR